MAELKEFTPEQEKKFEQIVDKWAVVGMGTAPADFEKAKGAICDAYKHVGAPAPTWWLLASSPIEAAKAVFLGKRMYDESKKLLKWDDEDYWKGAITRRELAGQPLYDRKDAWAQEVYTSLMEELKPNVVQKDENGEIYTKHEELPGRLAETFLTMAAGMFVDKFGKSAIEKAKEIRVHLTDFGNALYAKTEWKANDVRSELSGYLSEQRYGSQDTIWLALAEFFRDECGLIEETEPLQPLNVIAEAAGWWSAYKGFCCIQNRFTDFHLNEAQVVHREDGPAIAYRDGVKIWVLEGRLVDEQIVMYPETQTLDQIDGERDADIQAVRIERYGWLNYAKAIKAKVLDQEINAISGTPEILCDFPGRGRRLLAGCVTGKFVAMGVPGEGQTGEVKTCAAARKWLQPPELGQFNEIAAT